MNEITSSIIAAYRQMAPISLLTKMLAQLDNNFSEELQQMFMEQLCSHKIFGHFQPSISYRKAFFKCVINYLESSHLDICENLLLQYTKLLCIPENEQICFKFYSIGETSVLIKESINHISCATTGLCSWPGSLWMIEWALENQQLIKDKCVLELGSGIGTAGLLISKCCFSAHYIFTDCNELVLNRLCDNVIRNFKLWSSKATNDVQQTIFNDSNVSVTNCAPNHLCQLSSSCSCSFCCCNIDAFMSLNEDLSFTQDYINSEFKLGQLSSMIQSAICSHSFLPSLAITQLDWINFEWQQLSSLSFKIFPDIILAAEVIYDPSVLEGLSKTLNIFLSSGCTAAYVVIVERNSNTVQQFMTIAGSNGLKVEYTLPRNQKKFFYDDSLMKVLKISRPKAKASITSNKPINDI